MGGPEGHPREAQMGVVTVARVELVERVKGRKAEPGETSGVDGGGVNSRVGNSKVEEGAQEARA